MTGKGGMIEREGSPIHLDRLRVGGGTVGGSAGRRREGGLTRGAGSSSNKGLVLPQDKKL